MVSGGMRGQKFIPRSRWKPEKQEESACTSGPWAENSKGLREVEAASSQSQRNNVGDRASALPVSPSCSQCCPYSWQMACFAVPKRHKGLHFSPPGMWLFPPLSLKKKKKNRRPNNTTLVLTPPHTKRLVLSFFLNDNCPEVMDNSPFSFPQHRAQIAICNLRYSINNYLINKWQMFEQQRLTYCAQTGRLCSGGDTESYSLQENLVFLKRMLFQGHDHQMTKGGLTVGQDRREGETPVIRVKKVKWKSLRHVQVSDPMDYTVIYSQYRHTVNTDVLHSIRQ